MRVAARMLLAFALVGPGALAGCGGAPRLPPGAAMLARYQVATQGIPAGRELRHVVVVQDRAGGPRLDRAVVEALRASGRRADLLPAGTVAAEAAARSVGADAVLRVALKVKREARQRTAERVEVSRPKTGFSTYIAPTTPVGVPEGTLYPRQAHEKTVMLNPIDQHLVESEVRLEVVRVRDGKLLAAWREDLGAFRVGRPAPGTRTGGATAPSSQAAEEVPAVWVAVLRAVGGEVVRWLEAPAVTAERPLWKVDSGPAKAATRRGIDAARADDWGAAETAFRAALGQAPRDPRTHANLAVVLERRGDRAAAHAALREAARLDPQGVRFAGVLHDFARSFLPPPDPAARVTMPASAPKKAPGPTSAPAAK